MYGYYACRALSCKGKLRVDPLYLLENRSRDTQQMDADKVLEDPAGRRILDWLPLLIRGGGLVKAAFCLLLAFIPLKQRVGW
jgi:hypothetical protein